MNNEKKQYEVEELLQLYERMVDNIKQLSLNAFEQLKKLKGYMATDEIASDYCNVAKPYAFILFENGWISKDSLDMIVRVDKKIEEMTKHKELWTDRALIEANEWKECRELACKLLNLLEQ